jgi:UDP-N-acetylglucosamine acyltransferase
MEQHQTAIVSSKAEIGKNVKVGPFSIIEDDVIIGDDCLIDCYVSIKSGSRLGNNIKISAGAAIGGPPQDLKYAGEKTELIVGENTIIREFVTLNRGTVVHGKTEIGKNCLFMAYAHVAHDCILGDNVILVNSAMMGGHVEIGDWAIVGGKVGVHQFCHVGEHSMIGGCFKATQDVLPFSLAAGYPLRCMGLNLVGLRRRGFSNETIDILKKLFRFLMSKKLNTTQALKRIDDEVEKIPEVLRVLDFINKSTRGVIK